MISMIDTVGNALKNDIALSALVGNKIYWIRPATNPTLPYITYFELNNAEIEGADDIEYQSDIDIQVDTWTSGSFIPVIKEIDRIMCGLGFSRHSMPDSYEEQTQIFHKPIQYSITKEV